MARAGRDERAWVRGAQRGSASDFETLFDAHWPAAHRAAYLVVHDTALAEDIAQEAFLGRDPEPRPVRPPTALRAVAPPDRREPRDRRCPGSVVAWRDGALRRGGRSHDPQPVDRTVLAALAALPPEQRAVVVMRHLLGYTPGEIARALDLPRGTVNSRLRRGLDAMRSAL